MALSAAATAVLPGRGALLQQRQGRLFHRRRCCRVQARHAVAPAAAPEEVYSDPLAEQRSLLGERVVRHVAGIEQSPDLAAAVHLLPVRIEAPHAWQTLADGMAAHGGRALRAALSPRRYPVPSYAAASLAPCRCQLAGGAVGRRFRARPLNLFLALLFDQVPAAVVLAGLPPVHLNRWDLHHAHIFLAPSTGQLGLLLHAREFPAACAERFPVDLGHCQRGSPLEWDDAGMDHRNLLWIHGTLACLDVSAPQLAPLLMPGLEVPRTVLEHDLGRPLADVFYLAQLRGRKPAERVFVCVPGDV